MLLLNDKSVSAERQPFGLFGLSVAPLSTSGFKQKQQLFRYPFKLYRKLHNNSRRKRVGWKLEQSFTHQFGNTGSWTCSVWLHGRNQWTSWAASAQNCSGWFRAAAKARPYFAFDPWLLQDVFTAKDAHVVFLPGPLLRCSVAHAFRRTASRKFACMMLMLLLLFLLSAALQPLSSAHAD